MRNFTKRLKLIFLFALLNVSLLTAQTFSTNGSATSLGGNCWQLTPNLTNLRGSIWNTQTINLNNSFDITFHYTATPNGADGAAFVLQSSGTTAVGGAGSGLGYGQPIAISPSLAVELDLWDNSVAGVDDITQDHIAIHGNGVMTSALAGPIAARTTGGAITDGVCREFRIVWTPGTNNMDVYFDGVLRLSYVNNIRTSIFSGNSNVYFGFTAATGGAGCQQTVCYEFADAGSDDGVCIGSTYQLSASGGSAYTWSPNFFLSSNTISNPVFTPPPVTGLAGYSVSVDNSFGCSDKDSVYIQIEAVPAANAGTGATICSGDSTQIGAAPVAGRSYSWSPTNGLNDPTSSQPMASPGSFTTYTLTVTDTTGFANCFSTSQVTINVNQSPIAQAGFSATICEGQCTFLGVPPLPAHTYAWSPATGLSSSTSSSAMACPITTTTYTLTIDNGTCTDQDTVTVTVNSLPTADAGGNQTICEGSCASIGTATVSGNTYSWTPVGGLSSATVAQPTACPITTAQYNLSVTNTATSCLNQDSVLITVNPAPLADAGPDTNVCSGSCVDLGTTGTAGINYSWAPATGLSNSNLAVPTACPNLLTTYILIASNSTTNCQAMDTVVVDVLPIPSANAGPDSGFCAGDSVQLGSTGQSGFSYNWIPTFGLSNPTAANPMASPAGTVGYILTLTEDSTGCSDNDSVTITFFSSPIAGFNFTSNNQTATFTNTSAAGSSYSWDFGDGSTDTTMSPVHTYNVDSTYTVCLTVSNGDGCTDSICKSVVILSAGFTKTNLGELNLFPNPATDHFMLSWKDLNIGKGSLKISDLSGRIIWKMDSVNLIGNGKQKVDFTWAKGTYFVIVEGKNGRMVRKLLVR